MSSSVGGRDWWLNQLQGKTALRIADNQEFRCIQVSNEKPLTVLEPRTSPEGTLKDALYRVNLFPNFQEEQRVRLGSGRKQIDMVSRIGDSIWVIEHKIVKGKGRGVKIGIREIGQAIGQAYALSYLYKNHYQQHLYTNIMPSVCVWSLGSGKSEVLDLCQMIGITLVEVSDQTLGIERPTASLYYLSDRSPRPFCEDWRPSVWIVKSVFPDKPPIVSKFPWEVQARTHAEWLKERLGHKQVEVKSIREGDAV